METWKKNLAVCWLGCFATSGGMSLVVPFLSIFIQELGVKNIGRVEQLNGYAFGITFLAAAFMSPLWGKMADTYGRKRVLMCTSLGLSLVNILYLFTPNVYVLVFFRLIQGLVSGFNPAANAFIAKETPDDKVGWALATLSTGSITGTLLGPVIGGYLDELMDFRDIFAITAVFLFMAFLVTTLFIKENNAVQDKPSDTQSVQSTKTSFHILDKTMMLGLIACTCLMNTANQSIEPIVTLFVKQLLGNSPGMGSHASLFSGFVISATGFGILCSAPRIGKFADQTSYSLVLKISIFTSALVFIPMAFVKYAWQLMALRFLLGITQAGIFPVITTLLKKITSADSIGKVFGYNQSAHFLGLVIGPVLGGQISSHFGFTNIFFSTSGIMLLQLCIVFLILRPKNQHVNTP